MQNVNIDLNLSLAVISSDHSADEPIRFHRIDWNQHFITLSDEKENAVCVIPWININRLLFVTIE